MMTPPLRGIADDDFAGFAAVIKIWGFAVAHGKISVRTDSPDGTPIKSFYLRQRNYIGSSRSSRALRTQSPVSKNAM